MKSSVFRFKQYIKQSDMTRELRQSSQEVSAYMNPRKRVVQTFSLWTSIHTFIQVNILILPLWPLTLKLDNPSYYFLWCLLFIILTNREERLPRNRVPWKFTPALTRRNCYHSESSLLNARSLSSIRFSLSACRLTNFDVSKWPS